MRSPSAGPTGGHAITDVVALAQALLERPPPLSLAGGLRFRAEALRFCDTVVANSNPPPCEAACSVLLDLMSATVESLKGHELEAGEEDAEVTGGGSFFFFLLIEYPPPL